MAVTVLPADAGMSPTQQGQTITAHRAPRRRGDEPGEHRAGPAVSQCSPQTRG